MCPRKKDRRRYELHITPNGERMLAGVRKIIAQHEAAFLAPLSNEDRTTLRRIPAQLIS